MPKDNQSVNEMLSAGKYKCSLSYPKMDAARFRERRLEYAQEERRLNDLFKADLLAELGLTDHPKAQLLWDKAWEHGHANGLHDVLYWAGEFSEMIK